MVDIRTIAITTEHVSSDCDTCGTNYDEGGTVVVDGVEVFSYTPVAACWGNRHLSTEQLLIIALRTLGIEVTVDGEIPHNCQTDADIRAQAIT